MRALLFVLAALPLSACNVDLSFESDATTIHATGLDAGTIDVSICGGPSGLLDCNQDGHAFTVAADGMTVAATEGLLSFGTLDAIFDVNRADLAVTVTRDDGATGTVTLPPPFVATGPSTARGGDQIAFAWKPGTGDPMAWSADVACGPDHTSATSGPVAFTDLGELQLSTDDLPRPADGACSVAITLTRTRTGTMYAPFAAGSAITGEQTSQVTFALGS